jgi:hypothetical protein
MNGGNRNPLFCKENGLWPTGQFARHKSLL